MAYTPPFQFQWQNPELCVDIYPFRLEKLRDAILYFFEADLWQAMRSSPVDPAIGLEVVQEYNQINLAINQAKSALADAQQKLKILEQRNRDFIRNLNIRILEQKRIAQKVKLTGQEARIRLVKGSITWYQNYAKTHPEVLESPYYLNREKELAVAEAARQETLDILAQINASYQAELEKAGLGAIDGERENLKAQMDASNLEIKRLKESLLKLPKLGKNGEVSPGTAVRWMVIKKENELKSWDQEHLIQALIDQFRANPVRFPTWLQYMILHFSGMRYQSAHGSWASARDLVETLKMEQQEAWIKQAPQAEIEAAASQAIQELTQRKESSVSVQEKSKVSAQIALLSNPNTRKGALLRYQTAQAIEGVRDLTEDEATKILEGMKDQFPEWAWKEIVSRTSLRLQSIDPDWETLTPVEQQDRWTKESQHWREIMNFWEQKDITGWRKQHELTLSLVVTRAVCNEIAEHIQHLRGVKPAAGLTAKPEWYLKLQRTFKVSAAAPTGAALDKPYFLPPGQRVKDDFRPGASILWLGWVDRLPNPWQIAHPLDGIKTLPPMEDDPAATWKASIEGNAFVRVAKPASRPRFGQKRGGSSAMLIRNWLRWTHEAIVVGTVQMSDGRDYVMTFETGQIGLRLRPLSSVLNDSFVYVGYVPPAPTEPANLAPMLDPAKILPAGMAAPRDVFEEVAAPVAPARPVDDETLRIWQTLSPREQQVVGFVCREISTREMSERMGITTGTVNMHIQNAMRKFGVHSRQELRQKIARAAKSKKS